MIYYKKFNEIDLSDVFFDSLKSDYSEFSEWFDRKSEAGESAYVFDNSGIQGFLYLKAETEEVLDVTPPLERLKRIKVGTFKINPHGTRLGEKFMKKIFDHAVVNDVKEIYVTIFAKHEYLIKMFEKYGFTNVAVKSTTNGVENVMLKNIDNFSQDIVARYPLIDNHGSSKFILSIYPEFHSRLFPDSILNNESYDVIKDVSHTNSIHKIYICYMDLSSLNAGDTIVIYRTSDNLGPAAYRSVVTSVCVVEEIKTKANFANINDYLDYCRNYSVFNEDELRSYYNKRTRNFFVLKMTYNAAFKKRIIRKTLIEDLNITSDYWGFFKLTSNQFNDILKLGEINASIIIN